MDDTRETLRRYLASRRADPEFEARLARIIEEARPVLDRLAEQDGPDETYRQMNNDAVRERCARQAIGDRAADQEWLTRFDSVIAGLPWWAWRRRRFYRSGKALVRRNAPAWCPLCGCEHRPSRGCPSDFIAATPLGIMTSESIEEYDGG